MKAIQIDRYEKGQVNVVLRNIDMPAVGDSDVLV